MRRTSSKSAKAPGGQKIVQKSFESLKNKVRRFGERFNSKDNASISPKNIQLFGKSVCLCVLVQKKNAKFSTFEKCLTNSKG